MRSRPVLSKPLLSAAAMATLIAGTLILTIVLRSPSASTALCSPSAIRHHLSSALVHYATSKSVPQQSSAEISLSLAVLLRRSPCNFLVFGLGRDSQLWAALNAAGHTLFLEEDPEWFATVTKTSPNLHAHYVKYRTRLDEADALLKDWKSVKECRPKHAFVEGNKKCRLALESLPNEVYEREWDVMMIDAPKGYFASAPGRMAAIWTAAVMGRRRKGEGELDVFLHDVDRRVEKTFANEFLCEKNRVEATGRLWHFVIPKVNMTDEDESRVSFC